MTKLIIVMSALMLFAGPGCKTDRTPIGLNNDNNDKPQPPDTTSHEYF